MARASLATTNELEMSERWHWPALERANRAQGSDTLFDGF